jgi:hypothetical protein
VSGGGRRIAVTFFKDAAAQAKRQENLTAEALLERIRTTTAHDKASLPWLKLARLGNTRTAKGSLRHDRNLIAISGVEADYDGERIRFDDAVYTAEKTPIDCILYTSPSHSEERPRWRILCPTSREYPPKDRSRLLGRLNGLYRGVFSRESWTLSQAYYFGAVNGNPAHQVEVIDGTPIDQLDELDAVWHGPPGAPRGISAAKGSGREARDDAELIRRVVTGEGFHCELTALAARYIGRGLDPRSAAETLRGLMLAHATEARDQRWRDRFNSIGELVASAARKFRSETADVRRRIAAEVWRGLHTGKTAAEIEAAAIKSASALGQPLTVVRDVLAYIHARKCTGGPDA